MKNDSLERMLLHLGRLSPGPVAYNGKLASEIPTSGVVIGDSFFRRFSCELGCACCDVHISLDYMHPEDIILSHRPLFRERKVDVNGRTFTIWSMQGGEGSPDRSCRFLARLPGGAFGPCMLWDTFDGRYRPPSECIRAPQIQVIMHRFGHSMLLKKPFGRAWRYPRRPACKFEEVENVAEIGLENDIDRLHRMQAWAMFFHIETVLPEIIHRLRGVQQGQVQPGRAFIPFSSR